MLQTKYYTSAIYCNADTHTFHFDKNATFLEANKCEVSKRPRIFVPLWGNTIIII